MKRITTALLVVGALLLVAAPAGADTDHDATQDKQVLHANGPQGHDLGGGAKRKTGGWGANACQATGWDDPLNMPVNHQTVNNYQLHVRWCLQDGHFTKYSVWDEDGARAPFTHWQFDGTSQHVVNRFPSRVYARFVGTYQLCVAWIFPYCVKKTATVHITVYSYNRRPSEGGSFSDGWS